MLLSTAEDLAQFVAELKRETDRGLPLVGAALIWPMLQSVDAEAPETALKAFKRNALIGAAVLLVFAGEPIWRMLRPSLGM